jgi:hypothetical protein
MTPHPRPQGLGEKQLAWCKANIPAFADAWKAVKKADEHSQRVKERLLEGERT